MGQTGRENCGVWVVLTITEASRGFKHSYCSSEEQPPQHWKKPALLYIDLSLYSSSSSAL